MVPFRHVKLLVSVPADGEDDTMGVVVHIERHGVLVGKELSPLPAVLISRLDDGIGASISNRKRGVLRAFRLEEIGILPIEIRVCSHV